MPYLLSPGEYDRATYHCSKLIKNGFSNVTDHASQSETQSDINSSTTKRKTRKAALNKKKMVKIEKFTSIDPDETDISISEDDYFPPTSDEDSNDDIPLLPSPKRSKGIY